MLRLEVFWHKVDLPPKTAVNSNRELAALWAKDAVMLGAAKDGLLRSCKTVNDSPDVGGSLHLAFHQDLAVAA